MSDSQIKIIKYLTILMYFIYIVVTGSMGVAFGGDWYKMTRSSDDLGYLSIRYSLYQIITENDYENLKTTYIKNMDINIFKLMVAIGVLQYMAFIFHVASYFAFRYTLKNIDNSKIFNLNIIANIFAIILQVVASFLLLAFNPIYKNTFGDCGDVTPNICTSFSGDYKDSYLEIVWGGGIGWIFSFIAFSLLVLGLITTLIRNNILEKQLTKGSNESSSLYPSKV